MANYKQFRKTVNQYCLTNQTQVKNKLEESNNLKSINKDNVELRISFFLMLFF